MPKNLLLEAGFLCLPDNLPAAVIADLHLPVGDALEREKITFSRVKCWLSQHRIGILIEGISDSQNDSVKEIRGPRAAGAYDLNNLPSPAAKGFAAAQGVEVGSLITKDVDGEKFLFAVKSFPGQSIEKILPDLIKKLFLTVPLTTERWRKNSIFPHPPVSFCVMLDDRLIPVKFEGLLSEDNILVWNGLKVSKIKISQATDYVRIMNEAGLMGDPAERRKTFEAKIRAVLPDGYLLRSDPTRTARICSCSESRQPVLIKLSQVAMDLPEAVLHRYLVFKCGYLACEDQRGRLLPAAIAFSDQKKQSPEEIALISAQTSFQLEKLLNIWKADSIILTERIEELFKKSEAGEFNLTSKGGKCAALMAEILTTEKERNALFTIVSLIENGETAEMAKEVPGTGFALALSCLKDSQNNRSVKESLMEICSYFAGRIPAPKTTVSQIVCLGMLLHANIEPINGLQVSIERIISFLRAANIKLDLFAIIQKSFSDYNLDRSAWIRCCLKQTWGSGQHEFIAESFYNSAEFDAVSFCELLRDLKDVKASDIEILNSIFNRIKSRVDETRFVESNDFSWHPAAEIFEKIIEIEKTPGIAYDKILNFFNEQKINIEACLINLPSMLDEKNPEHLPRISILQRLAKHLGKLPFILKDRSGARKIA